MASAKSGSEPPPNVFVIVALTDTEKNSTETLTEIVAVP
jgi:hypothetical protein